MNSWLDTLGPAARACNPAWRDGGAGAPHFPDPFRHPAIKYARAVFHWSDIVHDHAPIRPFAPPGTFCFTMLRDPVRRLISQFSDWRRLTADDLQQNDEELRNIILDSNSLPITEFLRQYGDGAVRPLVDNYLTRALAASRLGERVMEIADPGELLEDALHVLHTDFDFVGLAEEFDLSRNTLCALLGLPPCGPAAKLNRGSAYCNTDPASQLSDELKRRFTCYDRILYDAARRLFEIRYRALGESYSRETFEQRHAAALTAQLRANYAGGAAQYSVSDPFYGTGLHQRDGGFKGPHAIWTISGRRAAIYVPVPAGMKLSLLLWIRGYADPEQRAALRVWVDGCAAKPNFERANGYEELIVIPYLPAASFVRLELEVPRCQAKCLDDARPRGVSFDAYGWRPIDPDTVPASRNSVLAAGELTQEYGISESDGDHPAISQQTSGTKVLGLSQMLS